MFPKKKRQGVLLPTKMDGLNGLNGLTVGGYVLRLIDGEKVKTQKIVIQ